MDRGRRTFPPRRDARGMSSSGGPGGKQNDNEAEYMHLFTADEFSGDLLDCDEGELSWIPKDRIFSLNLWEGDRVFLEPLLQDVPFFTSCLRYDGDHLLKSEIKVYVDRPESL